MGDSAVRQYSLLSPKFRLVEQTISVSINIGKSSWSGKSDVKMQEPSMANNLQLLSGWTMGAI